MPRNAIPFGSLKSSFCGRSPLCGWWLLSAIAAFLAILVLCHLSRNARVRRAEAEARAEKEAGLPDGFYEDEGEDGEEQVEKKSWWNGKSSRRDLELVERKQSGKLDA